MDGDIAHLPAEDRQLPQFERQVLLIVEAEHEAVIVRSAPVVDGNERVPVQVVPHSLGARGSSPTPNNSRCCIVTVWT